MIQHGARGGMRWVPIYYHFVTKDDGSGGGSLMKLLINHCEMNEAFQQFNIGFFISGIDTIKHTALWNYNTFTNNNAFPLFNVANKFNFYINGNMPGLCGEATFPGWAQAGGGVFVNKSCVGAGGTTMQHETGHYFNLLHTFESWLGTEYVDGSNCSSAGDGFCDTPADFIDYRAACPYTGLEVDGHGDFYKNVIDETLYMSYFEDHCTNRFSPEQQAEMNSCLTNDRAYLLNQTVPDVSPLDTVQAIFPAYGDTTIISGKVTFRWNSVPHGYWYLFTLITGTSTTVVDTLLTDTTFTFNLAAANNSYKYKVRAMSYGNTCSEFSTTTLRTALIKATSAITKPKCPGGNDGSIALTPSNGTSPYSFAWETGDTTSTITNLTAGNYTVTVTDANNNVGVTTVTITDPASINITISQVGPNLNALVTGGTGPYTYLWNNGEHYSSNNNVGFGTYTVTVTDHNNCTAEQTIVYSSIGVEAELKTAMKIFPNPASTVLNVQIDLNEKAEGEILLVNMNGEILQQVKKDFTAGNNFSVISISNIPSGIYLVHFKSDKAVKAERVTIVR